MIKDLNHIFVISDHHFFQGGIFAHSQWNDELIESRVNAWNTVVSPDDYVYYAGDFSDGSILETYSVLKRLNGHKILIRGNHDIFDKQFYLDMGFKNVLNSVKIENVIITHCPPANPDNEHLRIFGHVHNSPFFKDFTSKTFCCCVERVNNTPVSIAHAISCMNSVKN